MKKKKQNYSQLHYEQELAAQKRRSKKHPEPVPEIIPGKEDPQMVATHKTVSTNKLK